MKHSKMIGDSGFVDFVAKSLVTGSKSLGIHQDFLKLTENEWLNYAFKCSLFTED